MSNFLASDLNVMKQKKVEMSVEVHQFAIMFYILSFVSLSISSQIIDIHGAESRGG